MAVRGNPVKQKLASGGTTYGTMIFEFLSPGLPQMSVNAGAEFLFYDMEHSGFDVSETSSAASSALSTIWNKNPIAPMSSNRATY